MSMPAGTLSSVFRGAARGRVRGRPTAIAKTPVRGPVQVDELGLAGDEQGDRRFHGGPEKAVHHYAAEHYAAWREELGDLPALAQPPAFGENISSTGMTEQTVCLADHYRVGSVVLEVSQGRQPCWKLNERTGAPDMSLRVQQSGRTGWYYRVLQPGTIAAGDDIYLLERPYPDWTLSRLGRLLHVDSVDSERIRPALELPLPGSWLRTLTVMVETGRRPDQRNRLSGPAA